MSPIDDARRRAQAMRYARTDDYRRALARRICTDILAALKERRQETTTRRTR